MTTINTQTFGRQLHELLILATLRGGAKRGYQIALDAAERSGGSFELQHGTLYPILHRLEKQRLIRGKWAQHGGRPAESLRADAHGSVPATRRRGRLEAYVRSDHTHVDGGAA